MSGFSMLASTTIAMCVLPSLKLLSNSPSFWSDGTYTQGSGAVAESPFPYHHETYTSSHSHKTTKPLEKNTHKQGNKKQKTKKTVRGPCCQTYATLAKTSQTNSLHMPQVNTLNIALEKKFTTFLTSVASSGSTRIRSLVNSNPTMSLGSLGGSVLAF